MSDSFVPVSPGNGLFKIASYRFTFGENNLELQRFALNDANGAELKGQKLRVDSLPVAWSVEDLAALLALQSAGGWVTIPGSGDDPLTNPVRAVIVTSPGNLVLELADGSINAAAPIAVTPSPFPIGLRAIRKAATCTAGVIGLK